MLLNFDDYRSHIQLFTLEFFNSHGVICVSLPSHMSHFVQPLDVSVFRSFKQKLRQGISRAYKIHQTFEIFDACSIISNAHIVSITRPNSTSIFVKPVFGTCIIRGTDESALDSFDFTGCQPFKG